MQYIYAIDICSYIPMSGCVGMGSSTILCPGAFNAVKTTMCNVAGIW
jgi:hypothetical protein